MQDMCKKYLLPLYQQSFYNIFIVTVIAILFFALLIMLYELKVFFYLLNSLDISEVINYKNKRPLVIATYGHTSMYDSALAIFMNYKVNKMRGENIQIRGLVAHKHRWIIPELFQKYCIFIDNDTKRKANDTKTKTTDSNNVLNEFKSLAENNGQLFIWIEGTRKKLDYVRSGFYHIAENIGADILLACPNYKSKKMCCKLVSREEYSKFEDKTRILEPLKELVEENGEGNIAFYPECLGAIRFKQ